MAQTITDALPARIREQNMPQVFASLGWVLITDAGVSIMPTDRRVSVAAVTRPPAQLNRVRP
jgi:hypothetical protein